MTDMTEFTKYKIAASSIATLLGAWGPARQYYEICNVVRKSPNKLMALKAGTKELESHNQFLQKCEIVEDWERLKSLALNARAQEHIQEIETRAENLLIGSPFVSGNGVTALDKDLNNPIVSHCNELKSLITGCATRAYGTNSENEFIPEFNALLPPELQIHSTQLAIFKQCADNGEVPWAITGRIDGFQNGSIVEIKHRKSKLLAPIPDYELMQLHAYMFATDVHRSTLIQCARKLDRSFNIIETIHFIPEFWDRTFQSLRRLIIFIEKLVASDVAWQSFAACTDKQAILASHI